MLKRGAWPAWVPPRIVVATGACTGSAEAEWRRAVFDVLNDLPVQADVVAVSPEGGMDRRPSAAAAILHLGAAARSPPGGSGAIPSAILPSPTDADLIGAPSPPRLAGGCRARLRPAILQALAGLGVLPAVSVVVPNYNYAGLIEDRLRQIDGQTLPPCEIIVLDDASTDDSVARITALAPELKTPVRLLTSTTNSGSAFSQWAKGVEAATGSLVWIAEADDVAHPTFLARLAAALDDPAVAMAQSESREIGPAGEVRHSDYGFYLAEVGAERWAQSYVTDGAEHARSALAVMNTVPNVSAALFRTDVLRAALTAAAEPLRSLRLAGDWLVYLEVLSRGGFAFCAEALNDHRVHAASVTASRLSSLDRVLEVARLQQIARERLRLAPGHAAPATAYLQKLYDHFGLATPEAPGVFDHPAFRSLAPGEGV